MHKWSFVFLMMPGLLGLTVRAQDTNLLKTQIGVFEARTGTVIIKGFDQAGSMTVGGAMITVSCKVSSEAATGRRVFGLAVGIAADNRERDRTYIDYDELDSLLSSIDYLSKITYNVTPLSSFEASYTTRTGLELSAYSARRQGNISTFLQYNDGPKIPLTSDQMTQFYNLIAQAKKDLDSIRETK